MAHAELSYLTAATDAVQALAETQMEPIGRAADAVATAIAADRRVFVASTSHVLHSELVMRAGGLAARVAGGVVVGLTCVAYESWPEVVRDHRTRGRLMDLSHRLIDIGGVVG